MVTNARPPAAAKWLYAALIVMIVATGFAMIFKVGYNPAPALIMKPSKFDQVEKIGAVAFRRFYVPIEQAKRVVIGVPPQPEWQRDVVRGFLMEAASLGFPFEVIIADAQMPPLNLEGLPPVELHVVSLNSPTLTEFGDRLQEARAAGKRTLVYTISTYSTHLLEGNAINRYEKATGERLLSITSAPLALNATEERLVQPPCVGTEQGGAHLAPLGCEILKAGRGFYRKKIYADKFVAIMNAPGFDDYLLMIAAPGQGVRPSSAN